MANREIIADQLIKRYGDFIAVDGVSFQVNNGEIFGFLGPNGAGKSTTVEMLTTLGLPTEGKGTVGGYDIVKEAASVRRVAGVALQEIGLDPIMKSMELLMLQAQAFGLRRKEARKRAEELLELVKLTEFTKRPVGKYSGGMRRRLDLALALVHEPEILFLDEPTTGLDPTSRFDVWDEVRRLNRERGMTIFLTTQYLEEADVLADRIAIIDHGQIVAEGKPQELKNRAGSESIILEFEELDAVKQAQEVLSGVADRLSEDGLSLRLYMKKAAQAVPDVVLRLQNQQIKMESLKLTQPTLDDVFLQVTGQRYDADGTAEEATTEDAPAA